MEKINSSESKPVCQATEGVESLYVAIHPAATRRQHFVEHSALAVHVWENRRRWTPGDRPGIFHCPIPKEWVAGEIMTLREGETHQATIKFSARKGVSEEPRQEVKVRGVADPVASADVIVYSRETLGADVSSSAPWEIVAIRGLTETPNPRPLSTLLHNIFNMTGGTSVEGSDSEKLEMIRQSFLFWRDKVMVE
jgi:hypothetical protein